MNKKTVAIASLDLFHMAQLARALSKDERVRFYSTWDPRKPPDLGNAEAINSTLLFFMLWTYKRFSLLQYGNYIYDILCGRFDSWLSKQSLDQADVFYLLSGFATKTMQRFLSKGKPVVVDSGSCHTDFQHRIVFDEYLRNGIRIPLFTKSYRKRLHTEFQLAHFVQIPTNFVKNTYLEAGIPEEKLLLARYGTDVSRFAARTGADMAPKFRVICSSGVNLRKGARILVEAWRKLGWRDAELHWVGWPGHPQVRHLFRDPLPNVVWHGWMPHSELSALYRSCDVKVLPSFEEGLARVLLEAAASGLPLIATPNTGVEDFFTPGDPEGWLIEAGSVDALCSALEHAKNDRARTFALGQRAAARARTGFSWEDYGKQVRENFGKVVDNDK